MSGEDEDFYDREDNEVGPGGPPVPFKSDSELWLTMRRRLRAARVFVEAEYGVEDAEQSRGVWQEQLSPVQFGRRVFLEPSQPVNTLDIIKINRLFVAEGEYLSALNKLSVQDMFAASKARVKWLPKGADDSEEIPRLANSHKLLAMRAVQKATRWGTDRYTYWANLISYGHNTRGRRYFLSYEMECLFREVRVVRPTLNDAELNLLARLCGNPTGGRTIRKFFDEFDRHDQDLRTCIRKDVRMSEVDIEHAIDVMSE